MHNLRYSQSIYIHVLTIQGKVYKPAAMVELRQIHIHAADPLKDFRFLNCLVFRPPIRIATKYSDLPHVRFIDSALFTCIL